MDENKQSQMDQIAEEIQNLHDSPLYEFRQQNGYLPVVGEGSLSARILLVGEAPGEREAKTGRPFVGASGRLLSEMLASIGLQREDVYITNVVKDRPPENRDPTRAEIELYSPFLIRQIDIIRPEVIVTLGRFAMEFVFELLQVDAAGMKISELHGKMLKANAPYGSVAVVALFHPAVALYSTPRKSTLMEDFQTLKQFLPPSGQ
jgi:uracil-DNA glycosylase